MASTSTSAASSSPSAQDAPAPAEGTGTEGTSAAPGPPAHGRALPRVGIVVLVVGLVVTGALSWLTAVVESHTEQHLLSLQVAQAGIVLGEVVPTLRTPLDTSVAIADATGGNVEKVAHYVGSDVGSGHGHTFSSLSLWRLGPGGVQRLLLLGRPVKMAKDPSQLHAFLMSVSQGTLAVNGLLTGPSPRLGFGAVSAESGGVRYAVYAETPLPAGRRATPPRTSAFEDLRFALYLGKLPRPGALLEATAPPPSGQTASVSVPLGTAGLDFVASATHPLTGGLLPALPWIIAIAGVLLTAAGVVMSERLVGRRREAERLAIENHRLFAEQRSIAQSLQTALLPQELPAVEGVDVSVRYVPGDARIDIGGDWYDVIRCDDHSFIFVVGDVSGRGLPAAKTMASLHYAIRAYAAEGDDAITIIEKLGRLLDVGRDGQFATVLLGHVDVDRHEITLVNAGHLPPLVVVGGDGHFPEIVTGSPIGVEGGAYTPATVRVPPRASVLAYTDGLVERRGEILDIGLERLRGVVARHEGAPGALLDVVVAELTADRPTDDIALLELRWRS